MIFVDTVKELAKYGMDENHVRRMIRHGQLPPTLNVPNHTQNLNLLSKHVRLSDCPLDLLLSFIDQRFSVNQRMEVFPEWFKFPEEAKKKYLANPLYWNRDVEDWVFSEEALKQLTNDADLIHCVLVHLFTSFVCVHTEGVKAICHQLKRINSDPKTVDLLLRYFYHTLFSRYSRTVECIDVLIGIFGEQKALKALWDHPFLPRDIERVDLSVFRGMTPAQFEAMFAPKTDPETDFTRTPRIPN